MINIEKQLIKSKRRKKGEKKEALGTGGKAYRRKGQDRLELNRIGEKGLLRKLRALGGNNS